MPYGFSMKNDNKIIWPEYEDEDVWRTIKQSVNGRERATYEAFGQPMDVAALGAVRVRITSNHTALEPMVPLGKRYAVSQSIREFIETLEPGVHQFIPLEITFRNGEAPTEKYYLVNICNLVDAVDKANSRMKKSSYGSRFIVTGSSNAKVVLKKRAIHEMSLWVDSSITGMNFMSDDLYEKLHLEKCTRFDFIQAQISSVEVSTP
jgi:hypothetical protein